MPHFETSPPDDSARTAVDGGRRWTGGHGLALLIAILLAYFWPVVARGHVIYPHDNGQESGAVLDADYEPDPWLSTHRLDDQSTAYVAEMRRSLDGDHAAWIASWNPHNQLGRPLMQHFAVGRAWIVGNVVSRFTSDPFRFYTWMTLLGVCGVALFAFAFLLERGLHPLAALVGALAPSVGPFAVGWQTLPMLPWGLCWTFCVLLGIERWLRRPSVWNAAAIVFAVHGLLMAGYPQHVLFLGWSVSGYVLLRVWNRRADAASRLRALGAFAGFALLGLASALPVLLDLYVELERSVRSEVAADLVLSAVTRVDEPRKLWVSLLRAWDIYLAGHPFRPGFQPWLGFFRGFLFSPFFVGLLSMAPLLWRRREALWWLGFLVLALVATHSESIYGFGVRWMGLSLSSLPPIAATLLPAAVLVAMVVDALLRRELPRWTAALGLVPLVAAAGMARVLELDLDLFYAGLALAAALGACLFAALPRSWTLLPFALLVVLHHGRALLLTRPRAHVHESSDLIEDLRARTADGSRFAWIGNRRLLTVYPNQETLLGLTSIHTYYSFQTPAFAAWAARLSGHSAEKYERRFLRVVGTRPVRDGELAGAWVTHYVSPKPLGAAMGEEVARFGPLRVTEARRPGAGALRLAPDEYRALEDGGVRVDAERLLDPRGAVELDDVHPDRTLVRVDPSEGPSLLFVSRAHHPHWRASAEGRELATRVVNGLYLGVELPPDTDAVELRFRPHAHAAWIAQVVFALVGSAAAVRFTLGRRAARARRA